MELKQVVIIRLIEIILNFIEFIGFLAAAIAFLFILGWVMNKFLK